MPASWKTMTGPLPKRTGIDPLSAPGMSPANPSFEDDDQIGSHTVDNFSRTDQSDLLHHGCGVVKSHPIRVDRDRSECHPSPPIRPDHRAPSL